MIDLVIRLEIFLNQMANGLGRFLLAPIGMLPDLIAAIAVATVTGVLLLISFKYTSNQSAIKLVRNQIKAEFLALSLFKDDVVVNLGSQLRIVTGALKLILHSLWPIAVMTIPVGLLLGQLSLWWTARPLRIGEETVVTVHLAGDVEAKWPDVELQSSPAIQTLLGPVRVRSQRAVCWKVRAAELGIHQLVFRIGGRDVVKQFAVGNQPMRVSVRRPEWNMSQIAFFPAEPPFDPQSAARSIEIQYPANSSWCTGKDWWLIFWFIGSTVAALLFRSVFKVNL